MIGETGNKKSGRNFEIAIRSCLLVVVLGLLMPVSLLRAQAKTTVTDTIHAPDGSLPNGQIIISASSTFTAADGTVVFQGTVATAMVANGVFSVALVPNAGSVPAGTSYRALYELSGVGYRSETWVVPGSSSPVNLAAVRSVELSGPSAMVAASQLPPVIDASAIHDKGGQVFNVKAYGAKGDGVTDDTAAVNAAISAANAAHGGTIYFPPATYLIAGQLVFPNDGTGSGAVYAKQPSFEFKGAGNMENGQGFPVSGNLGGSVLNLTYNTASSPAAKIETFGLGLLTIHNLTVEDSSGDSTAFILTTGTTLHIFDDAFIGSKSGTSNNQDVLLLGGTNTTESNSNDPNAAFQGYGTIIRGNYFNHIRHAFYARTYVAHVIFDDNFIGPGTGSNQANDAPVVLDGSATGANTVDNVISQNRCEISGYYYCFKAISSQSNYFAGNDVEDAQNTFNTAIFYFDANSQNNLVINNVAPNSGGITPSTHVIDLSGTATVLDAGAGSPVSFGINRQVKLAPSIYTDTAGNLNAQQQAAATSGANYASPHVVIGGSYWNGSASANDTWTIFDSPSSGTNPYTNLYFSHSGSSGTHAIDLAGQSGDNQVTFAGGTYVNNTGGVNVVGGPLSITGGDLYEQNGHNLWVRNTTAATSGANQSSNYSYIAGQYWNGTASALDFWQLQDALGSGANPTSTLTWVHAGSTGATSVKFPASLQTTAVAFTSLPACASGTEGEMRAIADSTVNTWGSTIAGSGANHVLGYCDGTNWTVAAK